VRGETTTALVRHDLPPALLAEFLADARATLQSVRAAIAEGRATVARRVPEGDVRLSADVGNVLDRILSAPPALAPAIAGKR
jgi:hypothetical protein